MARLDLALFGGFEATLGGAPVPFSSQKERALLAYLAVEADRPHRRDSLADLLWPESPPAAAADNLRSALARLRRAIRDEETTPPFLLITRETLQFNRASDHALDVSAFQEALADSDASRAAQALALYRGDLLAGFALPDAPAWDDWALLARERLQRLAAEALRRLAGLAEQGGDLPAAAALAGRWVALAPWDEDGHRERMRLLAADGQRGAALLQYDACKRALQDELGVAPGAETTALYERIRDGAAGARPEPPPSRLPAPLLPLIGRDRELAELVARLRDPACRLLTLLGPGGVGKTRLALEAAAQLSADLAHGVHLIPLSGVGAAEGIVAAIARELGFEYYAQPGDHSTPKRQLLDYLRGREALLVLDAYEHLLECAGLIVEILEAAPRVKALVTSRARLNLPSEHLVPLEGLPSGLAGATPSPAAELFATAARRVRPDYAMTEAETASVAAICRRVEGLPLAILLAASWMHMLTSAEVAAELAGESGRGLAFLAADWEGLPERERSMLATLDHSWRLLTEREQAILAGLSVFRGGFTTQGAAAVVGATLRDLARLADRSLVMRRGSDRFDLHDLLREYAAARLAQMADAGEGIRDRHAAFFARSLAAWREDMEHGREERAGQEMQADWDNIRAAWDWAVARGRWDWLAQSDMALARHAYNQGTVVEVEALMRSAEERLRGWLGAHSRSGPALRALGQILGTRAFQLHVLRQRDQITEILRESLDLLEEAGRAGEEVLVAQSINTARLSLTMRDAEAKVALARAAELALQAGNQWEWQRAIHLTALRSHSQNRLDEARRLGCEALAVRRDRGSSIGTTETLNSLAAIAAEAGDWEDAARWADEMIQWIDRVPSATASIRVRLSLAGTLYTQGRYAEALPLREQRVAFWRDRGSRGLLAESLVYLGENEQLMGRYAEARAHLEEALSLLQEVKQHGPAQQCGLDLGLLALATGDVAEAERWLEQLTLDPPHPTVVERSLSTIGLLGAALALQAGRREEAGRYLCEELRRETTASDILPVAALYCAAGGDAARAVELYALARRDPWVRCSRMHEDLYGRPIAAAAADLPADLVAAAEERGRARDWLSTARELLAELERA